MNGYMGKILVVDLTKKELKDEPLNEQYARDFIGAGGIACRYLADLTTDKTDPLGPDNPLIFMAGLLTGTGGPSFSRWVVAARSPYTTYYGDANGAAHFGSELRFSGYDGIIVKGQSDKPVYLFIKDGKAELKDASSLWGKNTYQTIEDIRKEYDDQRIRVACIGQAGENKVLFANIMTEDGHCAGRAGMGCVMGTKKLKAIAVRGKAKIPMHDPEKFREFARGAMEEVKSGFVTTIMHDTGTCGWVDSGIAYGDTPTKYYTIATMPEATDISGVTQSEQYQVGNTACFGCPIGCRKVLHIKEGRFKTDNPTEGPEYETLIAWGPQLMIADMGAINHFNELVNGYGFDSISSGSSAAFAFYLYEKGVITSKDTGGLELKWGDIDVTLKLIDLIAKNEGFGKIIQEGTKRMAARYNCPGEAMQVKGLEFPMHDPRAYCCMGLAYATSNRGADHNKSDAYLVENGMGNPDLGLNPGDRWGDDKAPMVVLSQDWRSLTDALGICHFAMMSTQSIVDMINASTGWGVDQETILKAGERIFQLMRTMTCRFGVTPKDDELPEIALRPIPDGGQEGNVPNMAKMLPEYYEIRDWDKSTGKPSKDRMEKLGIGAL
ncbi:MAG: aldehyde ferredoxin oxidoreductase family protein [Dehalococcoidia bacterium]|nr:aldehyde ferredoxin oxidoreductase family protein [Dehalococcoidia bacterium]